MANNIHLCNAAIIGENPETAFIAEGDHLHAVELRVAEQKKDQSDPEVVIPLMKNALKALINYCEGKVEPHFLEVDWSALSDESDEQLELIRKIHNIYAHLPHHDRNELSSLIHHKQVSSKRK